MTDPQIDNARLHLRLAEADRRRGVVFALHSDLWAREISVDEGLSRLAALFDALQDVDYDSVSSRRLILGDGAAAEAAKFLELVAGRPSAFDLYNAVRVLSVEDRGVLSGWLCGPWTARSIKPLLHDEALAGMSTATSIGLREPYEHVRDRFIDLAPALAEVRIASDRVAALFSAAEGNYLPARYLARFLLRLRSASSTEYAFALEEALPHWSVGDTCTLAGWSTIPWQ